MSLSHRAQCKDSRTRKTKWYAAFVKVIMLYVKKVNEKRNYRSKDRLHELLTTHM